MTLRIEPRNAEEYALIDGTGEVGWLRPRMIGFCGFDDAEDALRAAAVAHAMVDDWLRDHARSPRRARMRIFGGMVRAAGDLLYLHGALVGRLVRPSQASVVRRQSFGFELRLPPEMTHVPSVRLARRIHDARSTLRNDDRGERSLRARDETFFAAD
jgi:hypothetical protein